jgi:hypothetical protein
MLKQNRFRVFQVKETDILLVINWGIFINILPAVFFQQKQFVLKK